jgi:2-polyprenyl-3-methyl-5-hydroxy-6-metoxy-1,4-benzoquinol methylase
METFDRKSHWENIYNTKALKDTSWYQPNPETSLTFVLENNVKLDSKIIDIGGGDSFFVDHLLDMGYVDITVLDISEAAINRAKERLGSKATQVQWIVADVTLFKAEELYDFWHDRAAFHFLTDDKEINKYIITSHNSIKHGGKIVVGTFSQEGPQKCSGIEIKQYSESSMTEKFSPYFQKIKCISVNHKTPFDSIQNFTFCSFKNNKILI